MIIKNVTNKDQAIRLTDRYGANYTIYLLPGRTTEVEPVQRTKFLLDMIKNGILKDVTNGSATKVHNVSVVETKVSAEKADTVECACDLPTETPVVAEPVKPEPVAIETAVDPEPVKVAESENKINETEVSEYVCEVCGAVFASARGLTRHMNKEHAE